VRIYEGGEEKPARLPFVWILPDSRKRSILRRLIEGKKKRSWRGVAFSIKKNSCECAYAEEKGRSQLEIREKGELKGRSNNSLLLAMLPNSTSRNSTRLERSERDISRDKKKREKEREPPRPSEGEKNLQFQSGKEEDFLRRKRCLLRKRGGTKCTPQERGEKEHRNSSFQKIGIKCGIGGGE